jgi:predicted acylesterase/phospholipase RssA
MPTPYGPPLPGSPLGPLAALWQPVYEQLLPHQAQQYLAFLGNEGMYRIRPEYLYAGPAATLFTDSFYDTTPLRQTLQEIVNFDRLNSDIRVVVTAVNVATGEVANFGNRRAIEERREGNTGSPFANAEGLSIGHILASDSIPPSFPPTRVEVGTFWDGGPYMNTPLSEAINCLERCDGGSMDVEREVVFVELVPMPGDVPTNMQEVVSRLLHILFSSKLVLDEKLFRKVNSFIDLARRLDSLLGEVPADSPLRKQVEEIRRHKGYRELTGHRRINAFTQVSLASHPDLANALDFSKATIEARIKAGYEDAIRQGIKTPRHVPAE